MAGYETRYYLRCITEDGEKLYFNTSYEHEGKTVYFFTDWLTMPAELTGCLFPGDYAAKMFEKKPSINFIKTAINYHNDKHADEGIITKVLICKADVIGHGLTIRIKNTSVVEKISVEDL